MNSISHLVWSDRVCLLPSSDCPQAVANMHGSGPGKVDLHGA